MELHFIKLLHKIERPQTIAGCGLCCKFEVTTNQITMANLKEVWQPIANYEGLYEVSNFGNVKSLNKRINSGINYNKSVVRKGRLMTAKKLKTGYRFVILYKNCVSKMHLIHRLVASAFLENPDNKTCVNHIDCVKWNNRFDNLEWVSHKENSLHSINDYHRGSRVSGSKLNEDMVRDIRKRKGSISGRRLAKEVGVSDSVIYAIWNYKIWKHIV